jgi:hypothetical protein
MRRHASRSVGVGTAYAIRIGFSTPNALPLYHAGMRHLQQIVGEVEIASDDIARRRSSTYRARAIHEGVGRAIGCIATQAGAAYHGIDQEIAAGPQLIDRFDQEIRAALPAPRASPIARLCLDSTCSAIAASCIARISHAGPPA